MAAEAVWAAKPPRPRQGLFGFGAGEIAFGDFVKMGAAYWVLVFILNSTRIVADGSVDRLVDYLGRGILSVVGLVLSFAFPPVLARMRGASATLQLIVVVLVAMLLAVAHTLAGHFVWWEVLRPSRFEDAMWLPLFFNTGVYFWVIFIGAGAMMATVYYAGLLRERDRSLLLARAAAQEAELRMLRYQINPHFLFNTLNALAALVAQGESEAADRVIIRLSNFYRNALSLDPKHKIPLRDELRVQEEYLAIEKVRFEDRIRMQIDIPDTVLNALVPSLILQPMVENAVKFGVARSIAPVTIKISARAGEGALILRIENDGPSDAGDAHLSGENVGLRNIEQRLRSFYGDAARLRAGPMPEGGYAAELTLPWERDL
jgi:signal transduction histidine kinase